MAEDVRVRPTPIQRNVLDAATDLALLYCGTYGAESVEELQTIFLKFYAAAITAERNKHSNRSMIFNDLLPQEVRQTLKI